MDGWRRPSKTLRRINQRLINVHSAVVVVVCVSVSFFRFDFNGSQNAAALALPFLYRYPRSHQFTMTMATTTQGICIGWDRNLLFMMANAAAALVYGHRLLHAVRVKYAAATENYVTTNRRRRRSFVPYRERIKAIDKHLRRPRNASIQQINNARFCSPKTSLSFDEE